MTAPGLTRQRDRRCPESGSSSTRAAAGTCGIRGRATPGVALGDHGVVREAGSIDELYRVAEDFRSLDIDVLGISGGDGTNGVTITGFLDVYQGSALPQIAFLRGGTMNTAANSVGVAARPPEGLLDRLVPAYVERASQPLAGRRASRAASSAARRSPQAHAARASPTRRPPA